MRVSRICAAPFFLIDDGKAVEGIIEENNAGSKATASRCRLLPMRAVRGEEKGKNKREKRANRRVAVAEFPPRKSPYPPTSILVPADRNEISICIREPGLAAVSELPAR